MSNIKWKFEGSDNWFSTSPEKLETTQTKMRVDNNISFYTKIIYENANYGTNNTTRSNSKHDSSRDLNGTSPKPTPIPLVLKVDKNGKKTSKL